MALSILRYAICGLFVVATGFAQTRAGTNVAPRFPVASIKPCKDEFVPDDGGRGGGAGPVAVDPGRIRIKCLPLENIIVQAYVLYANGQGRSVVPMREQWVRSGPSWIKSTYYAIDAKPEGAQTAAMMRGPMLQALLEDRFKLRIHRESKEAPAYALVVAKGGSKLEASKAGSCTPVDLTQSARPQLEPGQPPPCGSSSAGRDGLLKAQGWSMANLCRFLTTHLNRKVVDKTGITGVFDVRLDLHVDELFGPTLANMADDSDLAPDPAARFREDLLKLGLGLESFKDTAEFLVIDHVERPSEN
jgi:uncharacterized protein (TIGR03435 family)